MLISLRRRSSVLPVAEGRGHPVGSGREFADSLDTESYTTCPSVWTQLFHVVSGQRRTQEKLKCPRHCHSLDLPELAKRDWIMD